MRFESHLEALAREKAESAHSVADYFTRIGRPAIVNKFEETVQNDPTVNRLRALPIDLAIRGAATDKTLGIMHKIYQASPALEGGPTRCCPTPVFKDVRRDTNRARADSKRQRNMKKAQDPLF